MSVRIGDRAAITPSGISYTEMRPEDICLGGMDGAELPRRETASSETPPHLALYAATNSGAVVHPHSPEVIALSAGRDELPAIHYAITGLGGPVRVAPYVRFGSAGLAASAVTALDGRSAVILRNHGAVTYGRDLAQAYDRALLLEWLARTYRLAPSTVTVPSGQAGPLGTVTVLGAHILDVLGRPVEEIPPGQGSVRLKEIRATAAGTAAGTGVDLAKLGARVRAVGALGDDLLGDIVIAAMARHGVDTTGLIREKDAQTSATILPIRLNGERPAFHVPGATRLFTRADVDLDAIGDSRALLIGAPDALAGLTGGDLAEIAGAARSNG